MLQAGDLAPDFELPDAHLEMVRLSDWRGKSQVVLFFFNKDHTPGGIAEAQEFNDLLPQFRAAGAEVLGVSLDDCLVHEAFIAEEGLDLDLLADNEGEVGRLYGTLTQWEVQGVVRYGMERSTFVIDRDGIVRLARYHVAARGHAREVLDFIKQPG